MLSTSTDPVVRPSSEVRHTAVKGCIRETVRCIARVLVRSKQLSPRRDAEMAQGGFQGGEGGLMVARSVATFKLGAAAYVSDGQCPSWAKS